MPEQKRLWTRVFISAIILAALISLAVLRRQRAKESYTGYPYQQRAVLEPTAESTGDVNSQKISLNDIIKAARTWGPAYQSWYGKVAPDFTLADINGKDHRLSDYRGKPVILIFWATWCQPCRMEIPHLVALRNSIGEDKLAMLAISNEPPVLVKKFVTEQKLNYTALLNPGNMPEPYSYVNAIPCSFFIDHNGIIKLATNGLLSLGAIKAILQAK